ncbi:MAG: TauD/TfdA family dioxygenase [Bacteroidales bacterium]|nr:TauD/TfdA family dioxygenase [Bacteroidales bacterium]
MNSIELNTLKDTLNKQGYVIFNLENSEQNLLDIASLFGKIVPGDNGALVQQLLAQEKGNGSYGAFSYSVGFNQFPWHTDTAYWDIPIRYLMLASEKPSPCATLARTFDSLSSSIEDFLYLSERAVYQLDIPGKRRVLTPIIRQKGMIGFKFDFHIYKPVNNEAKKLNELMLEQLKLDSHRIVWLGNNVAIIDNWRVIHAREDAHNDKKRILKRVYINELV